MYPLPKLGPLLTIDDFQHHVGAPYTVEATPQPVVIQLERIVRGHGQEWMPREPFMLIFSSPFNVLLIAAHYRMRPAGGEPVELYLIPTQTAPEPLRYYHSVFN